MRNDIADSINELCSCISPQQNSPCVAVRFNTAISHELGDAFCRLHLSCFEESLHKDIPAVNVGLRWTVCHVLNELGCVCKLLFLTKSEEESVPDYWVLSQRIKFWISFLYNRLELDV